MASSSGGSTSSRHRHQYRLLANVTGQRSLGASCIRRLRVVAASRPASFASGCLTTVCCAVPTRCSLHYINYCWQRVFLRQPSIIISIPGQEFVCTALGSSAQKFVSLVTLFLPSFTHSLPLYSAICWERVEHSPVLPFFLYPVLL